MSYNLTIYALNWHDLREELPQSILSENLENSPLSNSIKEQIIELIQEEGILLESLEHNSGGGDLFRENFLSQIANNLFNLPLSDYLLNRDIEGLITDDRPCFGGLTSSEIGQALADYNQNVNLEDSDLDGWLGQLETALEDAQELGKDLVTIYL